MLWSTKKELSKNKKIFKKRKHFYKKSVIMNLNKKNNGDYKNAFN